MDFSHEDGWFYAPPIFSFSGRRKRENGPCTVQKRKRRFWWLRKIFASIEGRAGNLMRGRKDFLLFPRFAHGWVYVGWCPILPAFFW